jgi:UBX domain-containing protein 1
MVPRELEGESRNEQVEISLVDRRQEEYKAPPPPAYTAFSGAGQTMGYGVRYRFHCIVRCLNVLHSVYYSGASYDSDAVVTSAVTAERPVVDDKKPTTTLQIRLHNGTRLRETLNLDHTVRDLHAIIQLCVSLGRLVSVERNSIVDCTPVRNNAAGQPYTLLAGFPPRPISTQMDQTIDAAGLKGAAISQKIV